MLMSLPALLGLLVSCSESESYSDMLRDEEHAVNWWLAQRRVSASVPADSVFECGPDAPYYRMDEDGHVYMQVINPGSKKRPVKGDRVYFRFMRTNIKNLYDGVPTEPEGNADSFGGSAPTSIIYGNTELTSSTMYGEGIQVPLDYLGYDCEVNLVLKSYQGFIADQTECVPYVLNIRYFKAEY